MIIRTWHYYFLICFATCRIVRISSSGTYFNIQHLRIWSQNALWVVYVSQNTLWLLSNCANLVGHCSELSFLWGRCWL